MPRSILRTTSISARSLNANGASRPPLSMVSATSAMLRAGFAVVPAKITSSISPPRTRLAEFSPITQRSASTRFDLPQPFGPTTPVSPGSIASSVGSTKDLNPTKRSRETCIKLRFRRKAGQHLVELLDRRSAGEFVAVYEKGRGGVDVELFRGNQPGFDDLVFESGVFEAVVKLVPAHAAELDQPGKGVTVIARRHPFLLRPKERIDIGIKTVRRGTARDHRRPQRRFVQRVVA